MLIVWCLLHLLSVFFFNDTATTEIYTLSLHDALPISHADDVVVGMRAEHQHGAAFAPSRVRAQGGHALLEDLLTKFLSRATLAQQFVKSVIAKIVVVQFQQRLADFLTEPNDGVANPLVGPGHRADFPRPALGAQLAGSRLVEDQRRIGMDLQKAGWHGIGRVVLGRLLHDRRFVVAESEQDDPLRFEDRTQAHGQGLLRHVLFAEETAARFGPRHRIERGQPRPAMAHRARLVEPDVPGPADAQALQFDSARLPNRLFVAVAIIFNRLSV